MLFRKYVPLCKLVAEAGWEPVTLAHSSDDRVYVESNDECIIQDPVLGRRIRVEKSGSGTTVVWNPWIDKSIRMLDFPDHGYREMVCIEAANAFQDTHDVAAGEQHVLSTSIGLESA